jgi:hypothetical protein
MGEGWRTCEGLKGNGRVMRCLITEGDWFRMGWNLEISELVMGSRALSEGLTRDSRMTH